jgi:hypothetical protein
MGRGWTVAEKKDTVEDPIAARLAELDRLIEEQKARLAQTPTSGADFGVLERILNKQLENQQALAESQRTIHRQNPQHPGISAFSHPEGEMKRPKARLRYETFFNGHREREDDLTPAEIDAYNRFEHSCEARGGRWIAQLKNGRLVIDVPSRTIDDRMDLPNGLVLILTELSQGARAVDQASMVERIAELERKLAGQGVSA